MLRYNLETSKFSFSRLIVLSYFVLVSFFLTSFLLFVATCFFFSFRLRIAPIYNVHSLSIPSPLHNSSIPQFCFCFCLLLPIPYSISISISISDNDCLTDN